MSTQKNGTLRKILIGLSIIGLAFAGYAKIAADTQSAIDNYNELAELKYYSNEDGKNLENDIGKQTVILESIDQRLDTISEDIEEIKDKIR